MNIKELQGIRKLYFGCDEIARALGVSGSSAKVFACRYARQGLLVRMKRNMYIARDVWKRITQEELFALANVAQVPSYVSFMSALGYYDATTQIQRGFIENAALKRTKEISVDGAIFNYVRIKKELYFGFVKKDGFFIATPEKALLDTLYFMSINRYRCDLSSIDFGKMDAAKLHRLANAFPPRTTALLRKVYGHFKTA